MHALRRFRDTQHVASLRVILSMLLCLATAGCPGLHTNEIVHVGPIRADFVVAIERAPDVPPGSLFLKPIPGALLGKSTGDPLFRSEPGTENIRISASALSSKVDGYARPVLDDAFNPGELVRPHDLRIARIGTFYEPAVRADGCNNFQTGLELERPAGSMLVYVDRAGTVRGQRYLQPYVMDYRLDFPQAGIYVVALHAQGMVLTQRVADVSRRLRATVRRTSCE